MGSRSARATAGRAFGGAQHGVAPARLQPKSRRRTPRCPRGSAEHRAARAARAGSAPVSADPNAAAAASSGSPPSAGDSAAVTPSSPMRSSAAGISGSDNRSISSSRTRGPDTVLRAPSATAWRSSRSVSGLQLQPQARGVAQRPQDAGGVVQEAARMQHAQAPGREVLRAAGRVVQAPALPGRQGQGHRVHGEVAPAQIVLQARGLHRGQRAGRLVALATRAREVHRHALRAHRGGAEAVVQDGLPAQALRQFARELLRVALHGQVHVGGRGAADQVADRAAHQVGGRQPVQGAEQPVHARQRVQAGQELFTRGRGHAHILHAAQPRTGIPAAARLCLASWTVCWP